MVTDFQGIEGVEGAEIDRQHLNRNNSINKGLQRTKWRNSLQMCYRPENAGLSGVRGGQFDRLG